MNTNKNITSLEPQFVKPSIIQRLNDNTLYLECFVFSIIDVDAKWYRGNMKIVDDSIYHLECPKIGINEYVCRLKILKFMKTRDALYECIISNMCGECVASFNIKKDTLFYPEINVDKAILCTFNNVKMKWSFKFTCTETPTLNWYEKDILIEDKSDKYLSNTTKIDTNQYESSLEIINFQKYNTLSPVSCLVQNKLGENFISFAFFNIMPEHMILLDSMPLIHIQKVSTNEYIIKITLQYTSSLETTVKWHNDIGEEYTTNKEIQIINSMINGTGKYKTSLIIKNYKFNSRFFICKIENKEVDFITTVGENLVLEKISKPQQPTVST
uniref:Ig-like domain-containing protein n=1 Tax=Parastrongyloides trichosuri TaxID=131310 RepID=A0A0N4ZX56_PARTI